MPDRRGYRPQNRRYPRTARINEVLREILGEALEAVSDSDERLQLVTITGVECEPDLRHARVFYSARTEGADEALMDQRVRLQAAIGRETRLKRTPLLAFFEDSGITEGWRIEAVLKELESREDESREDESREDDDDD